MFGHGEDTLVAITVTVDLRTRGGEKTKGEEQRKMKAATHSRSAGKPLSSYLLLSRLVPIISRKAIYS